MNLKHFSCFLIILVLSTVLATVPELLQADRSQVPFHLKGVNLVEYYSPDSYICRIYKPILRKVHQYIQSHQSGLFNMKLFQYNCKGTSMCQRLGVKGIPSLHLYLFNSSLGYFDGVGESEDVVNWMWKTVMRNRMVIRRALRRGRHDSSSSSSSSSSSDSEESSSSKPVISTSATRHSSSSKPNSSKTKTSSTTVSSTTTVHTSKHSSSSITKHSSSKTTISVSKSKTKTVTSEHSSTVTSSVRSTSSSMKSTSSTHPASSTTSSDESSWYSTPMPQNFIHFYPRY